MYSLPIANYFDYWRTAKSRSLTMGGTLVLASSALMYSPATAFPLSMESIPILERINQVAQEPEVQAERAATLSEGETAEAQITWRYRLEDVEIPIITEYIETESLLPGTSKVQEEGQVGIERRVIRTTFVGGEISDEEIVNRFMLNTPKKRVVMQNTQPVERSEMDLSQYQIVKTMEVEATAYTYTGYPTATGLWPREGLIAVDPRVIPLGTELYVEGYGYAVAADTGGAIKGNIIDVFFPSLQRCIEWGRRTVTIHIIEKPQMEK